MNMAIVFRVSLFSLFASIILPVARAEATFDSLYNEGIQAYLEENWSGCISKMEQALKDYRFYMETTALCRIKCHNDNSGLGKLLSPSSMKDMQFFEIIVKQTLCLMKCKKSYMKNRRESVAKNILEDFADRKPYDYLQLCYYKANDPVKAASAAYTFLLKNRKHEVMVENLRFFLEEGVNETMVTNLEAKPFVDLYLRGVSMYESNDFDRAANYMEKSLTEYTEADEECRALCEAPFDQGWFPDFISSVANHYTYTIRCKQKCPAELGDLNGDLQENLFASHYHYLQISYYKIGDIHSACRAAASYLLFFPEDQVMQENKKYFISAGASTKDFVPRPEATRYFERDRAEKELLHYIDSQFQFPEEPEAQQI